MADEIISSFDLDTRGAIQQVDRLIGSIDKLEAELNQLQKEGKDTSAVQAQLAQQTATLNKVLAQETKTVLGNAAANRAIEKSLKSMSQETAKATNAQGKLDGQSKKTATSFVSLIGRSKNLGQAFTRSAAGLSNLVGGFGLSTIAISTLSNVVAPLVEDLFSFVGTSKAAAEAQESVATAIQGATAEYVNEARDLAGLLGPLKDANTSTADRAKLIDEIKNRYPEYLKGLSDEDFALGKVGATQKILNDRILEGILLKAKEGEQTKLLQKIIENELKLSELRAKGIKGEQGALETLGAATLGTAKAFFNPIGALLRTEEIAGDISNTFSEISFQGLIKENAELIEAQKTLNKRFDEAGEAIKSYNLDLGENKSVANEVLNNTKKADAELAKQSEASKKRLEKQRAEAAKTAKGIAKANEDLANAIEKNFNKIEDTTEPLRNSLAGLRSALAGIEKQLNEQTAVGDFAQFAVLKKQADELRGEIELVELAIESIGKKPIEIKFKADTKPFEDRLETAKLALGELRSEQAKENLDLAKQQAAALELVRGSEAKQAKVKKDFALQAEEAKRNQALATLRAQERIAAAELDLARQTGEIFGEEALKAEADLAEIQQQILAVTEDNYQAEVQLKINSKGIPEDLREKLVALAEFAQGISDQVFDVVAGASQRANAKLDESITRQTATLDALLSNVETANVEQVRLEQERLDKLNEEKKRAADREAVIAQAQIGINLALAVAKAAAEGGAAAPITIATTLAAAVFGFIKARQAAIAAYKDGTPYLDDPTAPQGTDTILIRADRGEAIIPKKTNAEYSDAVKAIYNRSIPADALNKIAKMSAGQVADLLGDSRSDSYQFIPIEAKQKETAQDAAAQLVRVQIAATQGSGGAAQVLSNADVLQYIDRIVSAMPKQQLRGRDLVTIVQSGANKLNAAKRKSRPQ